MLKSRFADTILKAQQKTLLDHVRLLEVDDLDFMGVILRFYVFVCLSVFSLYL